MTKPFTTIAAVIFAAMALVHAYRLYNGFDIVVAGNTLPQWVSIAGVAVTALLAVMLWRESRR
jgi:hypothetical protein